MGMLGSSDRVAFAEMARPLPATPLVRMIEAADGGGGELISEHRKGHPMPVKWLWRREGRDRTVRWRLTRRWFLLASTAATLLPRPAAAARGEPFSDGTRFSEDGTGWVD